MVHSDFPNWTDGDHEEWQASFGDLLELLTPYGRNSAVGEGDFWLLPEDWENREHVIHLDKLQLLEQGLAQRIRELLARRYPNWVVSIIIIPPRDRRWPNMGILITKDAIEDHLDRSVLPDNLSALRF